LKHSHPLSGLIFGLCALAASCGSAPDASGDAGLSGLEPKPGKLLGLISEEPAKAFALAYKHFRDPQSPRREEAQQAMTEALRRLEDWAAHPDGREERALTARISLERVAASEAGAGLLSPDWDRGPSQAELRDALAAKAEKSGQGLVADILRGTRTGAEPAAGGLRGSMEDRLKGVCTIWVNRGLKVESHVAVPDRVIGSGFFIDEQGHLLTNYHVIASEVDPEYEGYSRLYVRLSTDTSERIPAKVVGWDEALDLALLKAPLKPEYVFDIAEHPGLSPGDRIYAIGSPVGLESTVTAGIVSAVGRNVISLGDALQVDVAVNPGNSGGPLLDENGVLAGIIFAGLLDYQGLNFALPTRWIIAALPSLYAGGRAVHGYLGLAAANIDGAIELSYAVNGSGARDAGIQNGQRLISVDGLSFSKAEEVRAYTMGLRPGSLALVTTESVEGRQERFVDVRTRPYLPLEAGINSDSKEMLFPPLFGMEVERIKQDIFTKSYRVARVYKGGVADEAGLSVDDPFVLKDWKYDQKNKVLIIQLYVKRQKKGFLETIMQIPAAIEYPILF
jgi:S1-C subfamily serine protease